MNQTTIRPQKNRRVFLDSINSTIIQCRTYLAPVLYDGLVINDAKVDEFVAMVERAKKIYVEKESEDTLNCKRKRGEKDVGSDYLSTLRCEMQCVDAIMRVALP
jgi:hypothetical protein